MASFRDMCFTPAEFASIAKIGRDQLSQLETNGLIKIIRKRVGNVDRKMITLVDMQNFFRTARASMTDAGRHGARLHERGTGAELADATGFEPAAAVTAADANAAAPVQAQPASVAAATAYPANL